MVDSNMQNRGEPLRKIKKIKRPVKRIVPAQPQLQPKRIENEAPKISAPSASLDELLDNNLNLPTLNRGKVSNTSQPQPQSEENYSRPTRFLSENDFAPKPRLIDQLMQGDLFTLKGAIAIGLAAFLFGIIFTKVFLGDKKVVKDGLQGVVLNAEVPRGRARCGVAERTQGCVLYVMNPQRQDLMGRDFYDLASQLTGRQRFVIETGNMRYSTVKIRPGDIAQINIPPLQ